jgi:signal transduction histidine kinase
MTVPLRVRGKTIGAFLFVTAESGRHYTETDLSIAQELADRAAQAIDNARLYNEAQQAIRMRDEFLSVASHELRTPLTPLSLHLRSMQRHADISPGEEMSPVRMAAKLQTMSRQVSRLEKLVEGLLDFSRIASEDELTLDLDEVDLTQLAAEVIERNQAQATQVGSTLKLSAPGPVMGRSDEARLIQVLSHLIANALKFGAGKPVDVILEAGPENARLTVRDYGIGISPEDRERIFQQFERGVPTRHYGGFGLGLWIVKRIVEALHGSIRVESEVGTGSRFIVDLPLQPEQPRSHARH